MPTFRYDKLVRNNIPAWHKESGHVVKGRQLDSDELKNALIEKLHEEADELRSALHADDLLEEVADVQQVIDDLCAAEGISKAALVAAMQQKADKKGSFSKGEYIDAVMIPNENDKWAQYCRQSPDKYPEVEKDATVLDRELPPPLELGLYRHYKGGLYDVTALARHSETSQWQVVYQSRSHTTDGTPTTWVRPYTMFVEHVIIGGVRKPRFEKLDEEA